MRVIGEFWHTQLYRLHRWFWRYHNRAARDHLSAAQRHHEEAAPKGSQTACSRFGTLKDDRLP